MANSLIDFGIVQPEASGSFLRGFQGAQALAQQQAAQQQQNQLAALQLRAAQRGEEEALAEREAYKGAATLGDVQQRLMQSGLGKQSIALQKQVDEQTTAKLKRATDIHKLVQDSLRGVAALGTRKSAQGALANAKAAGLDVAQYEAELAQTPDAQIRQWALSHAAGADKALEQQIIDLGGYTSIIPKYATGTAAAPVAQQAQQPIGAFQGQPQQVMNQLATIADPAERAAATQAYQRQLTAQAPAGAGVQIPKTMTQAQQAAEGREQQRIGLEQRRVDIAEKEAARKEAGLAEPLSKQEIQKREAKYPQSKSSVVGFETQADDMIKKLEQLKSHKGLEGILGTVYGRTPSFTAESQAAQALYDQILAKGKFQELQNMRLASPTGGALGNVSNMEIQSLGQAFGALSRVQGKESFQAAIDDVIKQIQSSKERTREAFDETYQYKQGKPATAPAAGKAKFLGFE